MPPPALSHSLLRLTIVFYLATPPSLDPALDTVAAIIPKEATSWQECILTHHVYTPHRCINLSIHTWRGAGSGQRWRDVRIHSSSGPVYVSEPCFSASLTVWNASKWLAMISARPPQNNINAQRAKYRKRFQVCLFIRHFQPVSACRPVRQIKR